MRPTFICYSVVEAVEERVATVPVWHPTCTNGSYDFKSKTKRQKKSMFNLLALISKIAALSFSIRDSVEFEYGAVTGEILEINEALHFQGFELFERTAIPANLIEFHFPLICLWIIENSMANRNPYVGSSWELLSVCWLVLCVRVLMHFNWFQHLSWILAPTLHRYNSCAGEQLRHIRIIADRGQCVNFAFGENMACVSSAHQWFVLVSWPHSNRMRLRCIWFN